MLDTIGANVDNIPTNARKVAGYVTGLGIVPWSSADWNRFPNAGHVRIKQYPGNSAILNSDVIDVEYRAATIMDAVTYVNTRISRGIHWSTIYGTNNTLSSISSALSTTLGSGWHARVDCWLANWNLNEIQASALLGTSIYGFPCRAVQWASPTSNPRTIVPGGSQTLRSANVDISATQDAWYANSQWNVW